MPPDSRVGRFHEWAMTHPEAAAAAHDHVERLLPGRHALFSGRATPFSLTPYLMSATAHRRIARLCENLAEILETAGRWILHDPDLLALYAFPESFMDVLRISPGYDRLAPVLRLDGHFVSGVFRLVETNADGSAGMNDSNAIERSALETDLYRAAVGRLRLRSLDMVSPVARLLLRHARKASKAGLPERIGILDLPRMTTESEFVAIQERIDNLGGCAEILHPRDLRFGRHLTARDKSFGVIYRRLVTQDAWAHLREIAPLLGAIAAGRVRLVGSFRSELLHNKAILAALHSPRILSRLGRAGRALVLRHVPESHPLTDRTAERVTGSRSRWVLKPLDAYGSRSVSIGRMLTARQWAAAIRRARRSGRFLLQEYVPAPREAVMRIVDGRPAVRDEMTSVGFFLYDGRFSGPYVRSGPVHPLSISRGAVTRPGFVVLR